MHSRHRPDGERYSGDWFEGERSGHGVWTGPTGDDYQGEYKRDKRNGVGVYMFASGASGTSRERCREVEERLLSNVSPLRRRSRRGGQCCQLVLDEGGGERSE